MKIPLGEFAPDIAELDTGVAVDATNVYPGLNSYVPVKGPEPYSSAIAATPVGLTMAQTEAGDYLIFAGTSTNLYKLNTSTLAFDSVGSGYGVTADELWTFAQFGTDLIAAQVGDVPQVFDLEGGSAFAALSGSPPTARFVGVVEGHVFLLSTSTDPAGGQWSGVENATQWTAGSDGSDVFSFKDGGRINGIAGAGKIIIQERALRRIIHQPSDPQIFTFDKLEDEKGAIAPYSVIPFGSTVAYLSEDGFRFNGQAIGKDKIDGFFFSEVNQERLFSVLGTYDPIRPLFYWAYRTGTTDLYDRMLAYNWKTQRWSVINVNAYIMSTAATPGTTLEALDTPYPDLDVDVPYSLDSRIWQGGRPVFDVIGSDLKLAFYEGDNLAATVETGEVQLFPERAAFVRSVRPIVDSSAALARVGKRDRLADTRTFGGSSAMNASGRCPVRSRGRYHRFRVTIPAGSTWTHITGVEVEASPVGSR